MSLVDKKVESRFSERPLKSTPKLVLSRNIINQIDYFHKIVGKDEWSGVLVLRIDSGSIENPKEFALTAVEILPMDIGTAAYTEYEFDLAGDPYQMDKIGGVMLDKTLKMGHIHTHHSMGVFFSGTDVQELHDNAPNHNYYVSLIVNFESPAAWKAKVVYLGSESRTGTLTRSYNGTNGPVVSAIDLTKTEEVMYTMDLEIYIEVEDVKVSEDFSKRITDLKSKKDSIPKYFNKNWINGGGGTSLSLFDNFDEDAGIYKNKIRKEDLFTEEKVKLFLRKLLAIDFKTHSPLPLILSDLKKTLNDDVSKEIYFSIIGDKFDEFFMQMFGFWAVPATRSTIAEKSVIILERFKLSYPIVDELIDLFETDYILL